jgi:hypothetical protein
VWKEPKHHRLGTIKLVLLRIDRFQIRHDGNQIIKQQFNGKSTRKLIQHPINTIRKEDSKYQRSKTLKKPQRQTLVYNKQAPRRTPKRTPHSFGIRFHKERTPQTITSASRRQC